MKHTTCSSQGTLRSGKHDASRYFTSLDSTLTQETASVPHCAGLSLRAPPYAYQARTTDLRPIRFSGPDQKSVRVRAVVAMDGHGHQHFAPPTRPALPLKWTKSTISIHALGDSLLRDSVFAHHAPYARGPGLEPHMPRLREIREYVLYRKGFHGGQLYKSTTVDKHMLTCSHILQLALEAA